MAPPKKYAVVITGLLALLAFVSVAAAHSLLKDPAGFRPAEAESKPAPTVHTAAKQFAESSSGWPVRLQIPVIGVDAAIDYVRLTPQGALAAPRGPANAGWYDQGPRPGEKGNAIIDGHFGYKNHIPAVFDNLHTLQPGDSIQVGSDRGAVKTFLVRELRTYGPNDDTTDLFRSSDGKAHLNLITCQGVWNQGQKSYSERLVVFADQAAP